MSSGNKRMKCCVVLYEHYEKQSTNNYMIVHLNSFYTCMFASSIILYLYSLLESEQANIQS